MAQRGADAIVAVHFDFEWFNPQSGNLVASSELAVVAYGTAVRLKAPPDTVASTPTQRIDDEQEEAES